MKKPSLKTRLQWGWFQAAWVGMAIGLLLAPAVGSTWEKKEQQTSQKENPITALIHDFLIRGKVKVMVNGEVIALTDSVAEGENAYKEARLRYNADGIRILDVDVTYEEVDKERDEPVLKEQKPLQGDELVQALLTCFSGYVQNDKQLAYTMRIGDDTVTVNRMEDVVAILEQAQGKYDTTDVFQVDLNPPASRNVTMYEVGVSKREAGQDGAAEVPADEQTTDETVQLDTEATQDGAAEVPTDEQTTDETVQPDTEATQDGAVEVPTDEQTTDETVQPDTETTQDGAQETPSDPSQAFCENGQSVYRIAPAGVALTGEGSAESGSAENPDDADASQQEETLPAADSPQDDENEPVEDASQENTDNPVDVSSKQEDTDDMAGVAQAAEDGIKYVGFSETIQVMETYVDRSQIEDRDTAYQELTTENQEAGIYVVQPGDYLALIAEKHNLTVDELREMNPGIESDEDLYYDDRLNITVPRAAIQILVEKQETYRESYEEEVVYEDDADMFIGETQVVQEGSPGTHIVTDLVTYKDDLECDREQLEETVEVAAVAEIVKRGTKSQPTYMYPVTIWTITSNFGYRWGRLHAGVDVGVPIGTTVRASRAGQVITAGWVGGYGNCVIIDHGDGISTRYGHLSEVTVSVGQYVDQGQQVALSGNTGRSTGPHLHFEIRVNGEAVDPLPYLE